MSEPKGRLRCPTHPRFPADECPACEKAIERAELAADEPDDYDERWERWDWDERGGDD